MNTPRIHKTTMINTLAMAVAVAALSGQALAENEQGLTLQQVMQNLGTEMQHVTDGISREEWSQVEIAASRIAEHPQPSLAERKRVMGVIGTDASLFKSLDKKTHETAHMLKKVAAGQDGESVIDTFATLQHSCLACHQRFRKPVQKHFHDQK